MLKFLQNPSKAKYDADPSFFEDTTFEKLAKLPGKFEGRVDVEKLKNELSKNFHASWLVNLYVLYGCFRLVC